MAATVDSKTNVNKRRSKLGRGRWVGWALLVTGALAMLFPIVWMVSMAFKPHSEIYAMFPTIIPHHPTVENFISGWTESGFGRYFSNSLNVTFWRVTLSVVINALAGFGFGKYEFRGRNFLFLIILSAMMIPDQLRMIPLYSMMSSIGLIDTHTSVVLPSLGMTFGTFLMRQYVQSIPDELMEASRIDGCSEFGIFWRIIMPLSRPALVTNVIFQFMWAWNDLLYPLLFLQSDHKYTVQLALALFSDKDTVTAGPIMAMAVLSIIPMLIIFFAMQRYFVRGIASSGLKA